MPDVWRIPLHTSTNDQNWSDFMGSPPQKNQIALWCITTCLLREPPNSCRVNMESQIVAVLYFVQRGYRHYVVGPRTNITTATVTKVTEHQSRILNRTKLGIHPCGDVTGLWQAGGAGRKDGGSWGAAIRRGKGKMTISSRNKLPRGPLALEFCVAFDSVCLCILMSTGVIKFEENPGLSTTTAASALIIFSSTSAHLWISNGGSLYGPDSE